ncbi:MAG: hypothetical protein MZV64_01750 [Ignavibacteriales bacterium]|nr:hypothetical protein [Ignavibacteriales bacterium]
MDQSPAGATAHLDGSGLLEPVWPRHVRVLLFQAASTQTQAAEIHHRMAVARLSPGTDSTIPGLAAF